VPANVAWEAPLPPSGPVDNSVVCSSDRSYTSANVSVSALTSGSAVVKKTREPSADAPTKSAETAPLPPAGPVDTCSSRLCSADAPEASPAAASNDPIPTAAQCAARPPTAIFHLFTLICSSCPG
jgi:hypothetical protein